MKKASNVKKGLSLKKTDKVKEAGELRKPAKLKPLSEKEKKNWKKNVDEDEDDSAFNMDDSDLGLDNDFDESGEENEEFFDDTY